MTTDTELSERLPLMLTWLEHQIASHAPGEMIMLVADDARIIYAALSSLSKEKAALQDCLSGSAPKPISLRSVKRPSVTPPASPAAKGE